MAFWLKKGKFVSGNCEECPCKYPCEDEDGTDPTCPCDCNGNAIPENGGEGGSSGNGGTATTAIEPIDEPVAPPEKPCHCVYWAVFVITCPCNNPNGESQQPEGKCPPTVCNCTTIVQSVEADQLFFPADPCCHEDPLDGKKEDCAPISREPEPGTDIVGHTDCGGTIHRPSPMFCKEEDAQKWLEENPCPVEDCTCFYHYFVAVETIEGKAANENECPPEAKRKCTTFTACVRGDDHTIPAVSIFDVPIECLSIGNGGGTSSPVATADDPKTGGKIEIFDLGPSKECTDAGFNKWIEENRETLQKQYNEICVVPKIKITYTQYSADWSIWYTSDDEVHEKSCSHCGNEWKQKYVDYIYKVETRGPSTEIEVSKEVGKASYNSCWGDSPYCCQWVDDDNEFRKNELEIYKNAMEIVKNTDSWPNVEYEGTLPTTFQSALGGRGGYFVKEFTIQKAEGDKSSATGVKLCVLRKITDINGEETTDVSERSASWGDKIYLTLPIGTWDEYSLGQYENSIECDLCECNKPHAYEGSRTANSVEVKYGKVANCSEKISIIGYLYQGS